MKYFLSLLVSVFVLSTSSVHADTSDTMNVRVGALGLLLGAVNVGLDYKITDSWTIGPELMFWRLKIGSGSSQSSADFDVTAYGAGARANWFMNGAYTSGLYVGPSLKYIHFDYKGSDKNGKSTAASTDGPYAEGLVGYGWFWKHFNMMLGGGLSVGLGGTKATVTHSDGSKEDVNSRKGGLAFEYTLGWTF